MGASWWAKRTLRNLLMTPLSVNFLTLTFKHNFSSLKLFLPSLSFIFPRIIPKTELINQKNLILNPLNSPQHIKNLIQLFRRKERFLREIFIEACENESREIGWELERWMGSDMKSSVKFRCQFTALKIIALRHLKRAHERGELCFGFFFIYPRMWRRAAVWADFKHWNIILIKFCCNIQI